MKEFKQLLTTINVLIDDENGSSSGVLSVISSGVLSVIIVFY